MKRKGYTEGMDQLETNPELAGIEVIYFLLLLFLYYSEIM
jgi:hypothetical protein